MARATRGMTHLRDSFNARWPGRDKASDGGIGDAAHQGGTSGHNPDDSGGGAEWDRDADSLPEWRAIDVDADLRESGTTMQEVIDHMRGLPNLASVLRYMIFNRKIYRASNGWRPETYTGSNPHDKHAHYSGAWTNAADENTSFNYRFGEVGIMADANVVSFSGSARDVLKAEATEGSVGYAGGGLPSWPGAPTGRNFLNCFTQMFGMIAALAEAVEELQTTADKISTQLESIQADPVDNPTHPIVRAVRYAVANPE